MAVGVEVTHSDWQPLLFLGVEGMFGHYTNEEIRRGGSSYLRQLHAAQRTVMELDSRNGSKQGLRFWPPAMIPPDEPSGQSNGGMHFPPAFLYHH